MPERGGDTIWASTYAAYDALSPAMQQMLDGSPQFHDMGLGTAFVSKAGAELTAKAASCARGPSTRWCGRTR